MLPGAGGEVCGGLGEALDESLGDRLGWLPICILAGLTAEETC